MKKLDFDDVYPFGEYEGQPVFWVLAYDPYYFGQLGSDKEELWDYTLGVRRAAGYMQEEYSWSESYIYFRDKDD